MEENAIVLNEQYSFSKDGKLSSGVLKNIMKEWVCINDNETNILVWVRKSEIKKFEKSEMELSNR